MKKVLATGYRFVRQTDNKDRPVERVVLRPGDDAKHLPKEIRDDLEKRGLIVNEDRLTKEGARIPVGTPGLQVEEEPEAKTEAKPQTEGDKPKGDTK